MNAEETVAIWVTALTSGLINSKYGTLDGFANFLGVEELWEMSQGSLDRRSTR